MQVRTNIKLSNILWYRIGGICKYLLDCENKEDIYEALEFIDKNNISKLFICGLGSNLVFTDEYFDGAVIRISVDESNPDYIRNITDNSIEAFAGITLDKVINFSLTQNLVGLEWAGGLPGTVGAAVRGNVGAYGGEIKDSLNSAEVLVRNSQTGFTIKKLSNQDLNFSYRHSLIKENSGNMVVLSATFKLNSVNSEEVKKAQATYQLHIQQRKDKHPLEYPNCGSVFKNIREPEKIKKVLNVFPDLKEKIENQWYNKVASGHLIQRLGLQGLRVGDAQVSEKHALFIVNLGQAKAKDVLEIVEAIQTKFMKTFGFKLETEVEIVY